MNGPNNPSTGGAGISGKATNMMTEVNHGNDNREKSSCSPGPELASGASVTAEQDFPPAHLTRRHNGKAMMPSSLALRFWVAIPVLGPFFPLVALTNGTTQISRRLFRIFCDLETIVLACFSDRRAVFLPNRLTRCDHDPDHKVPTAALSLKRLSNRLVSWLGCWKTENTTTGVGSRTDPEKTGANDRP